MTDDVRSSPHTGTVLPEGRPFWIVDGRAYDFTEWARIHPGGATWFGPSQGRDISALIHTYHRDPVRLRKFLSRYEIEGFTERDVLPKLGVPPFLLEPDFDAARDLPRLNYADEGSLLAEIRTAVNARFAKRDLKRLDRRFDLVTWAIGLAHVAMLGLFVGGLAPAWAFVIVMVLTRTALAGAGHYHLHRRWNDKKRLQTPLGKALFDINYVGTSLIGTDGHVLLHHPYMGSGADVKKTFFDGMLRLHPLLRVPGYTLHKLGICLLGLSMRAREIARFEQRGGNAAIRADFWIVRAWLLVELVACVATGHWLAWLVQFFLTLWFNTFLVVSSHDFEDDAPDDLSVIPVALRDDWAANQICLSYDLTIVGNRWIDLWLSAGLSPHRVHHVLPYQASGFANLKTEATVRAVSEQAGITWERPRNLLFDRFPAVIRHYLFRPVKALPPPSPPAGATPLVSAGGVPIPPGPVERPVRGGQLGMIVRYTADGFRGVGV
ncbi:fatty acid desaturase [Paractinoplanes lichenicola]|uniref:Fatty acid desaturase n=1 Tax=Paractinoplanes lichenicola TaxID=2802976 RepID=A0ABS1VTB7_9ACTN|nr:fatty acid desaturase [Actinoplanes lichenicola]MBL7257697.1 fatty acid desaturase [Actinoplanes lichenicola]